MDIEVSSARKETQDAQTAFEKETSRIEETVKDNKTMLNGRIDASNATIKGINKEVGSKIEGLSKEIHAIKIDQEKNKNEILQAINSSKN